MNTNDYRRGTLTSETVQVAQPDKRGGRPKDFRDGTGLVLRCWPSGVKCWRCEYRERVDKLERKRMKTIGRWPRMGLMEARRLCRKMKERAAPSDAMSIEALAQEYIAYDAKRHKKSWRLDERMLETEILPVLGDRPVREVTRRECHLLIQRIHDRGVPAQAARTQALLRRLLQYAVEADCADDNAAARLGRLGARRRQPRERVLSADELPRYIAALQDGRTPASSRLALLLQLATAQRLGEVCTLEAAEIDRSRALWLLPQKKAKMNRGNVVPLSSLALEIIDALEALPRSGRELVPITSWTVRDHHRRATERAGLAERLTPHDLRRSAATWLSGEGGMPRVEQDRLLNHREQGVGYVYDRFDYAERIRARLEAWAATLRAAGASAQQGPMNEHERAASEFSHSRRPRADREDGEREAPRGV